MTPECHTTREVLCFFLLNPHVNDRRHGEAEMKQATLENIKGRDLPEGWAKRLGVRPDELVNVTIQPAPAKTPRFDRKAIERLIDEVASTAGA